MHVAGWPGRPCDVQPAMSCSARPEVRPNHSGEYPENPHQASCECTSILFQKDYHPVGASRTGPDDTKLTQSMAVPVHTTACVRACHMVCHTVPGRRGLKVQADNMRLTSPVPAWTCASAAVRLQGVKGPQSRAEQRAAAGVGSVLSKLQRSICDLCPQCHTAVNCMTGLRPHKQPLCCHTASLSNSVS